MIDPHHEPPVVDARRERAAGGALLATALLVAAFNLRPVVASVGPVLTDLRLDLALSGPVVSALTAVPVLCYGVGALVTPRLARRFGTEAVMAAALTLGTVGLVVRLGPNVATLFAGTLVAAGGIAAGNVLMPALVKRHFARRAGMMMGLFVSTLMVGAAASASVTVPLARMGGGGWRVGLGAWAVPAAVGAALWLIVAARRRQGRPSGERTTEVPTTLRRDPVAWQLTAFMGLQSMVFYSLLSWLPTILRSHGVDAVTAGHVLSVMVVMGAPGALVLPSLLTRTRQQRGWALGVTLVTTMGVTGLMVAPTAAPLLWAMVIGTGTGSALPLALTLVVLRSPDAQRAAQLSAMSQSAGFLLAAVGPFVVGMVHDLAGDWTTPLAVVLALLVPQAVAGMAAGRPRLVSTPSADDG